MRQTRTRFNASTGLNVRLSFRQADDFTVFFPLTALLQKLDALEAFQHVPPGGDGTSPL